MQYCFGLLCVTERRIIISSLTGDTLAASQPTMTDQQHIESRTLRMPSVLPCKPVWDSAVRLFLVGLSLGLILGSLLPYALVSRVASDLAKLRVGTTLDLLGHITLLDLGNSLGEGNDGQS